MKINHQSQNCLGWPYSVDQAQLLELLTVSHIFTCANRASLLSKGAKKVTITDREPALGFLAANVKENIPPDQLGAVEVSELTWGQGLERYPTGGFDIVLGADIVYLEDTFPSLLQTMEHLSSESSVVLLACKIRYERDTNFLSMLKQRFTVHEVHYDKERDIHIYKAVKLPARRDL